jgi:23S rRNA (guanosine2251-2'-O)-methyltransferase
MKNVKSKNLRGQGDKHPLAGVGAAPQELDPQSLILEGRRAVLEALTGGKPIDRVILRKGADGKAEGTLRKIAAMAREARIVVQEVDRSRLDELSETGHHQGVVALCPAVPYFTIDEILQIAADRGEPPFVVVLDGVTDPHNLGAVLRSAEGGGVHGVIIPKRRAVGLTGTVAKTSAGAISHMPVARVSNVSAALKELKQRGLWLTCADTGGTPIHKADFSGAVALVFGAEGEGVGRLVAEQCDFHASIPMLGKIESLNVSVAAGIFIYEVVRWRGKA